LFRSHTVKNAQGTLIVGPAKIALAMHDQPLLRRVELLTETADEGVVVVDKIVLAAGVSHQFAQVTVLVVEGTEYLGTLVELGPSAGGLHNGPQPGAVHLVKKMTEAVVGHLLGLHVLLNGQLDLAEEGVHKDNVDENILGAQTQPVLDPHDLEGLPPLTDLLDLLEDPDDLRLPRLDLAAKQIRDLKGDEVDVHVLQVLVVVGVTLLQLLGNLQEDMDDLVEIGHEGGTGRRLHLGTEITDLVLVLGNVVHGRLLLEVTAQQSLNLVVVLLQLLVESVHLLRTVLRLLVQVVLLVRTQLGKLVLLVLLEPEGTLQDLLLGRQDTRL
jgi:hypothetical protein